jgi:hypothetical protein
MDRANAMITATVVSGFVQDWTGKDGSKGQTARVFVLREGRNSPDRVDMAPETFAALGQGVTYELDCLLKSRAIVTATGVVPVLDVWVRSAVPALSSAHSAA